VEPTQSNNDAPPWNGLLSKYVVVWLWSVILGSSTGITFVFANRGFFGDWGKGSAGLLSAILLLTGSLLVFTSIYFSIKFFITVLIPAFFGNGEIGGYKSARPLILAARFLLLAFAVALITTATQIALSLLRL
jgi:hypothetical protein